MINGTNNPGFFPRPDTNPQISDPLKKYDECPNNPN